MNPMSEDQGLVSSLHRNSVHQHACTALASPTDTSRQHDKLPVFAYHGRTTCKQTALLSTENVLPGSGFSARTPYVQLERYPVGELSLSAEAECLSLHASILAEERKSGNGQQSWWQFLPLS
jgi:hypothetical protein